MFLKNVTWDERFYRKHLSLSAGSKKTSKDVLTQRHTKISKDVLKTPVRKHSLHTCEPFARNLDFLASVPSVGLPSVVRGTCSGVGEENSPEKSFQFRSGGVESKDSPDLCSECKRSDFPSKKVYFYYFLFCLGR